MKRKWYTPWLFIMPAVIFITVFVFYPITQNLYLSFFRLSTFSVDKIYVGFDNYVRMFYNPIFRRAIINNTWYMIISILVQVGFGLILALILESKLIGKEKKFFRTVLFTPSVIAIAAVGLMFYYIYNPNIGLLNAMINLFTSEPFNFAWLGSSRTAIFAIIAMSQWQFTGYIMVLLVVAIQKVPQELNEAAEIDGANGIQRSLFVTIPNIKEMILVCTVITVIGAYMLFAEVFVVTRGGPYHSSQVLGTFLYETAFARDQLGMATAVGMVIFIITFSASILQIKISNIGR